ncbi:flavin monoamine oxidase family protein [Lutimaribacter marinistellae]|uniref:Flavin monoamine oxidase family protein n=1 Tax=Lutimaribacter marinistellae TaxID=1820329 RepID=A0ABV7THX6_9RHOB
MTPDTEVAIIGAGLSGLALAQSLRTEGRNVVLLEARDRPGGRVLSQDGYDLGPAWIWPHNRRMLALADRLGLQLFAQHSDGKLVFEDAHGSVRRDLDFATMGGALRVVGGLSMVTDALARDLGDILHLGRLVQQVIEEPGGVTVTGQEFTLRAERVVVALPPRLTVGLGLSVPDVPTWMAGHAKLVAVFDSPFWRNQGLNGDAISHRGPLAEIHDASPMDATEGAMFGFAMPGAARDPEFRSRAMDQLARLFGPEAATPRHVFIKDWSTDPATSVQADQTPPAAHPRYRAIRPTQKVIFAGTETALVEGGFLEGALEAAETAREQLLKDYASF